MANGARTPAVSGACAATAAGVVVTGSAVVALGLSAGFVLDRLAGLSLLP